MRLFPGLIFAIPVAALLGAPHPAPAPSFSKALTTLRFEPDAGGNYVARGRDYRVALSRTGLELHWDGPGRRAGSIRMKLDGANPDARIEGLDVLPSQTNYFLGDSSNWRSGVRNYNRVRMAGVYPGIDLIFYGSEGSLEFDFDIAPGADPQAIRMDITGPADLTIDDGSLVLASAAGKVRWSKPVLYQSDAGVHSPVPGRFVLHGRRRAGFEVGRYDRTKPLVIDPVLSFSTYFGSIGNEAARGIGVDGAGNIYIAGYTTSRSLPVSDTSAQSAYGGQTTQYQTGDGFVAKFSPAGALLAMTYLGGSRDDLASGLAVDAAGNVYVTGYTNSNDFPFSAGAYQPRMRGSGGNSLFTIGDAFAVKLNSSLSKIIYSTCIGGGRDEAGIAIAIDAAGNAYLTGITLSSDFPTTTGAYQTIYRGSGGQPITDFGTPFFITGDAFVAKLNADGSQLVFSTYLGGSLDDAATSIAVDPAGNVYVGGFTISRNFPTTAQALQPAFGGADAQNEFYYLGDGFISKLNPTGTALLYSTYLGGAGDDAIAGIAVDAAGSVYATGATTSAIFPITTGAFRVTNSGPFSSPFAERIVGDAFAVKLKPDGSGLVYGTFLGGIGDDSGKAIAIDSAGNAYIAGNTASSVFPLTADATQKVYAGAGGQHNNNDLMGDGFVVVLDPLGAKEIFGTLIGGSMDDGIQGIALDSSGGIHITGVTMSSNFPTGTGAYQPRYGGAGPSGRVLGDVFVARFSNTPAFTSAPASVTLTYALGAAKPAAITLALSAPAPAAFTAAVSAPWLTVTPSSGQTPASLTLAVDPGGMAAGVYNATITISGTGSATSLSVPVTLTVTGTGAIPKFTSADVKHSASYVAGQVAPGEIVTIFGANMGPPDLVTLILAADGRVASTLAGTRILFDGVAAPVIYTLASQVSCVVPYSVAGKAATQVQISYNGILSASATVAVVAALPGIYTLNQQGTGQASALNQDNSYNNSDTPASVNSAVVLFGSGEGRTMPAVPDGSVSDIIVPKPELPVTATVGGREATVLYGASAPTFVAGALADQRGDSSRHAPGECAGSGQGGHRNRDDRDRCREITASEK